MNGARQVEDRLRAEYVDLLTSMQRTLTALMTGEAYAQSARIAAQHGGPFELFETNREPMMRVMNKHKAASYAIDRSVGDQDLVDAACSAWD